jgi:hypothetical protein
MISLKNLQEAFSDFSKTVAKQRDPEQSRAMAKDLTKKMQQVSQEIKTTTPNKELTSQVSVLLKSSEALEKDAQTIVAALNLNPVLQQFTTNLKDFLKRGERVEKSGKSNKG